MVYSGFWRRVSAKIIDVFIFLPLYFIDYYLFKHTHPIIFQTYNYLLSLIILVYNILFIYFKEATIGKMVLKMRVVQTDGSRVTLLNAFLRELLTLVCLPLTVAENITIGETKILFTVINNIYLLFFVIEHFIYFTNPNRKTLHDFIADTVVVSYKK